SLVRIQSPRLFSKSSPSTFSPKGFLLGIMPFHCLSPSSIDGDLVRGSFSAFEVSPLDFDLIAVQIWFRIPRRHGRNDEDRTKPGHKNPVEQHGTLLKALASEEFAQHIKSLFAHDDVVHQHFVA